MKKLFAFLAVIGILSFGASNFVMAQEEAVIEEAVEGVVDTLEVSEEAVVPVPVVDEPVSDAPTPLHQLVKAKFIEGNAMFMSFVLLCLIFGLALAIERIIYLNLATTNTDKPLSKLE